MKYEIRRENVTLGICSVEELERGLEMGRFVRSDRVHWEGAEEWTTLEELLYGESTPRKGLPWEDRGQAIAPRFFATASGVLLHPGDSFSVMKVRGGLGMPLVFGIIGSMAGLLATFLYQLGGGLLQQSGYMEIPQKLGQFNASLPALIIAGVLVVLFLPLWIFLGAGVDHLMLLILGGGRRGFEGTFRVYSYSLGSTNLLSLIPVCGGLVAFFWQIVARVIGYSRVHGISTFRAVIAVLLPSVLCCACVALLVSGIFWAGYSGVLKGISPPLPQSTFM